MFKEGQFDMRTALRCGTRTWLLRYQLRHLHGAKRRYQSFPGSGEALDVIPPEPSRSGSIPDARFEVTSPPFSLVSVTLSASQNLYTRKGTLVAIAGKPEHAISTLSILEPFRRAFLGIPFLYQRISSTSPITALIALKSVNTSITVIHLDGTTDWMLAGRSLVAWSGQTLVLSPVMNLKMSLAHWGSSEITGRGLLALAGKGSIAQIQLQSGESYTVHPSNVVAYSMNQTPPSPYRLKSTTLRLQIPKIFTYLPESRSVKAIRESAIWQAMTKILFAMRTWARAAIWGDRLFLQFHGPTTILLQTRASRISDILTSRDVNEIADAQPGIVQPLVTLDQDAQVKNNSDEHKPQSASPVTIKAPSVQTASIGSDGKVIFEPTGGSP